MPVAWRINWDGVSVRTRSVQQRWRGNVQQLLRGFRMSVRYRDERDGAAVSSRHVQPRRVVCVQQLQRGVCMQCRVHGAVSAERHLRRRHVQCAWCDVVHQL